MKPFVLLVVGHVADDAPVPRAATLKKSLSEVAFCMTRLRIKLFIKAPIKAVMGNVISVTNCCGGFRPLCASVIQQGHVGQAAKGWASASMPTPVTSLGWPRAVEVYCRTSAQQSAICTFSVAIPDHTSALEENWRALQSRHPEVLFGGDFLSHDWLADPFAKGSWLSCAPGQARALHQLADTPPSACCSG